MRHSLFLLYLCLPLIGLSQKTTEKDLFRSRNTIYVEGLGSGGFYSVNYERLLLLKEKQAYGFRVGISYFGNSPTNLTLTGELFALIGKGSHHGDFGIGITGVTRGNIEASPISLRKNLLVAVPRLSYRYQKPTGGLMLRTGFTPIIELSGETIDRFGPWLGLAIGHSF
ncbi:hypothetical protein EXU85_21875 [Spirosoma sp. KCTC 42546]|uniref:hypothetical protein n=1 Tax=Spirosoma sp. KCTC 42546 TaxID=2520506 RepID=UPI00115A5AAB|nr:hypothetical protein [Spirosoma sp. KCTC 42546]QDK81118.1 hypothetical protein EXU85_21875 [Spirosoma sp. KCTC 42546]